MNILYLINYLKIYFLYYLITYLKKYFSFLFCII